MKQLGFAQAMAQASGILIPQSCNYRGKYSPKMWAMQH
jgi:hypothetical protein